MNHPTPTSFCDGCGTPIAGDTSVVYAAMPIDLGDVNAGESAILCHECDSNIPDNYILRSSSK